MPPDPRHGPPLPSPPSQRVESRHVGGLPPAPAGWRCCGRTITGSSLLARIINALASSDPRAVPVAEIAFPDGRVLATPIDRLHELPRHESTARRRGRW